MLAGILHGLIYSYAAALIRHWVPPAPVVTSNYREREVHVSAAYALSPPVFWLTNRSAGLHYWWRHVSRSEASAVSACGALLIAAQLQRAMSWSLPVRYRYADHDKKYRYAVVD